MRVLMLVTDSYGVRGGIAHYNRCMARALSEVAEVESIEVLPRLITDPVGQLPPRVSLRAEAANSKTRYLRSALGQYVKHHDLVFCGHLNLLPLAAVVALLKRARLVLQVHGIDAWKRPGVLKRLAMRRVDAIWSVSGVTRDRMNSWAGLPPDKYAIIPNTIDFSNYAPGPKRQDLLQKYALHGRRVLLTLARLSAAERYKGIDEILEVLPALAEQEPVLSYVIAGEGDDRARLEAKAKDLKIADRVVFTGYVPESDKVDVLRLADVFAMPGSGEGFGIVYLEAMACGIPTIGSCLDASREALREGQLGAIPDPKDPDALRAAILAGLTAHKTVPEGLEYFSWSNFARRVREAVRPVATR